MVWKLEALPVPRFIFMRKTVMVRGRGGHGWAAEQHLERWLTSALLLQHPILAAPERMNSSCSLILDFKLDQHGSSFPILFTEGYFQKDPRISCWISLHFLGVSIAGRLQWMLVICIKMDMDGNGWTGNMEMIDPLDHLNEIVLQFILNNIEKHSNVYTSVKWNWFTQVVRNFSVGVQLWKENVSHSHEAFSCLLFVPVIASLI